MKLSKFCDETLIKFDLEATNKEDVIYNAAEKLFQNSWKPGKPVRLIGVGSSGLAPEQLNLWEHQSKTKSIETDNRLKSIIHDLREKFGDQILHWGEDLNNDK